MSSLVLSVEVENPGYFRFSLAQVADPRKGSCGPLGGLLAAMEALPPESDRLLLAPCDAPFLPRNLGECLQRQLESSGLAASVVSYQGELQPTFSLWRRCLVPGLRTAVIEHGLGGFKQFLDRVDVAVLEWPVAEVSPFLNINTPEDLARARSLLASGLIGG